MRAPRWIPAAAAIALAAHPAGAGEDGARDGAVLAPRVRVLVGHGGLVRSVRFLADGSQVASASFDGTVLLRDAATGSVRSRFDGIEGGAYWVGASADGRTVAVGGRGPAILVRGARGTRELRHPGAAWAGDLSADGTRVVAAGTDGVVIAWSAEDGRELWRTPPGVAAGWCALARHGGSVALAVGPSARIHSTDGGAPTGVVASHAGGTYGVAFSPDGALLATAGADAVAAVHRVSDASTVLRLPHFGAVLSVAFSPDGTALATGGADFCVRVWDVATGAQRARFTGAGQPVWALAWSPDGRTIACGGDAGTVVLWEPGAEPSLPDAREPAADVRPALAAFGLGVVAQHARGSCSVHTMTRAVEFALSRFEGRGVLLSDEFMNRGANRVVGNTGPAAADRGQFFEHLWMALARDGVCARPLMPWRRDFDPRVDASPEAAAEAAARRERVAFTWRELNGPGVPAAEAVRRVRAVLAAGWPVIAGSPHSVLVVGYVDDPRDAGGGRFVIADSGTGGFVERVTADRLHSAIEYARVHEYGFGWIVAHAPPPVLRAADENPKAR